MCLVGLPWIGAATVWWVGDTHPRSRNALAVAFSSATALVSVALLPRATSSPILKFSVGGAFGDFTFVPDELALWMSTIASTIGTLAVIFSLDYMRGESGLARYYALLLVFMAAMVGLVLSGSLLLLLVFWEIVGLCSCLLIAFHPDQPLAVSGAIRALIQTQIGGIGLLAGVLVARTSLGSDQASALVLNGSALSAPALTIVAYGFLVAACAKSAQVPFHTWLPGAMEAPTPVSALIHAATMVNAGVYLLLRFSPVLSAAAGWSQMVILVGLASSLLGGVMALVSADLKRVLAYSTISQLGLLFYAVGINAPFAAQFHMLSHAIFKGLLFLCAGAVIHATGTRELDRLGGLARRMPIVTATFVVGALALAGVPFLNGFWSKELILDQPGPEWARLTMLIASALTALYAARVTWLVFFRTDATARAHDAPVAMRVALIPLAVATALSWMVGWSEIAEVLTSPATLVGLSATLAGGAVWYWRDRLAVVTGRLAWLRAAALADFGFPRLEQLLTTFAIGAAARLQATQTGRLSWNLAAMFTGLSLTLAVLAYGGLR